MFPRIMVAIGAALTITALVAASAAADEFRFEKENTTLATTTIQQLFFEYEAGQTMHCQKVTATNTINLVGTTSSPSFLLEPTLDECESGGSTTFGRMNGCDLNFTLNKGETRGPMDIVCEPKHTIEFEVVWNGFVFCRYSIGSQTVSPVFYQDEGMGANRSIIIKISVIGISAARVGGSEVVCGKPTANFGSMSGELTVIGHPPGSFEPQGIWVA
jgi:hypothetical protein